MKRIIFTAKFMDTMYENMWQFINPEMLEFIFNGLKVTYIPSVDSPDSHFKKGHVGSICFKGDLDEGHYVYVDGNKCSKGTYECNLLTRDLDDGVCHGAAIAFYMYNELNKTRYRLIENPTTEDEFKHNYITILKVYLHLINSKIWDKALENFFYNDVEWTGNTTKQTILAKNTLKEYIQKLKNL